MQPAANTAEILAFKVLERPIGEEWVDWAIEMLMCGFDGEYLVMLAGERAPFNEFYMRDLTTKALCESGLDYSDKERVINQYVCYLIDLVIDGTTDSFSTLRTLKDLYIELDFEKSLSNFYTLFYAKDDLLESDHQWYWPGATRDNIDAIIKEHFLKWKDKCQV